MPSVMNEHSCDEIGFQLNSLYGNKTWGGNLTDGVLGSNESSADFRGMKRYNTTAFDGETLHHMFIKTVALPVASVGIVGNVFMAWVWHVDPQYNPTIFFIKYLAVCDVLYLIANIIGDTSLLLLKRTVCEIITVPHFSFLVATTHVSLAMAASRCVAVFRPHTFFILLSRRRAIVLSFVIAVWSMILGVLVGAGKTCLLLVQGACSERFLNFVNNAGVRMAVMMVSLGLPMLLMAVANGSLLVRLCRRKATSFLVRSINFYASVSQVYSRHITASERPYPRHLTVGVVCVTTTSLLAFPVGISARMSLSVRGTSSDMNVIIVQCVDEFFMLLNSSINIFYYSVFASEFRRLLALRYQRLMRRLSRSESFVPTPQYSELWRASARSAVLLASAQRSLASQSAPVLRKCRGSGLSSVCDDASPVGSISTSKIGSRRSDQSKAERASSAYHCVQRHHTDIRDAAQSINLPDKIGSGLSEPSNAEMSSATDQFSRWPPVRNSTQSICLPCKVGSRQFELSKAELSSSADQLLRWLPVSDPAQSVSLPCKIGSRQPEPSADELSRWPPVSEHRDPVQCNSYPSLAAGLKQSGTSKKVSSVSLQNLTSYYSVVPKASPFERKE